MYLEVLGKRKKKVKLSTKKPPRFERMRYVFCQSFKHEGILQKAYETVTFSFK